MAEYGYLNHSSIDKRDEAAIASMFAVISGEDITVEQAWSPGEKHKPAFEALLKKLQPGDTLYIYSIDRLGDNAAEVARVWKTVTLAKQADIVVLDDPLLDSRCNKGLPIKQIKSAAQKAFIFLKQTMPDDSEPFSVFDLLEAESLKVKK